MPVEKKKNEEYRKSRVGARERLRLDFLPASRQRVGMDGTGYTVVVLAWRTRFPV